MKYNYTESNGHYLINAEDDLLLIDTGNPYSFVFHNSRPISINNTQFHFNKNLKYSQNYETFRKLVGRDYEGIIGMDLLKRLKKIQPIYNRVVDTIMDIE